MDFLFILNSLLLGVGLTMDAFSVSVSNALAEPNMKRGKAVLIAGTFAVFQAAMPMIGWVCVHTVAEKFKAFDKFIPWIALVLLCYIGGKMIFEGAQKSKVDHDNETPASIALGTLFMQGVATSVDALSVGFTIAEYNLLSAIVEALIISVVTFGFCLGGVFLGRKIGGKVSDKSEIVGGVILVAIGLEIFIKGLIGG